MEQTTAKGTGFLKATGILMIAKGGGSSGLLYLAGILAFVRAATELTAGAMMNKKAA